MNNLYLNVSIAQISLFVALALVFTLLILLLVMRAKSKNVVKTKLKTSNKYPFEVNDLIDALGGPANILELVASYSRIKFILKDNGAYDVTELKKFSTGLIQAKTSVTLLFGNISKPLGEDINSLIK